MPELPEVETVRRGLAPFLEGHRLVRVEARRADLRIPFPDRFAERLAGRRVARLERRAKYIIASFEDGGDLWLFHLGMSGRVLIEGPGLPNAPRDPSPHDHVVMETDADAVVTFNDARRFGLMTLLDPALRDAHPLLHALGPEPLSEDFNGKTLAARLKGRATPIKAALLDQRNVAGLGNIYVCEALYRARLSPRRRAGTVQGGRAERLVAAVKAVLTEAIAAGGSTLRDHVQPSGELGYFQHRWAVYGKEGAPCPDCTCAAAATGGIRRLVQGGRSTFYCPSLQR